MSMKFRYAVSSILLGILFWLIQFVYQYYSLSGDALTSVIRSTAFTAATLIGIALLIGPVANLFPRINFISHRRIFGVVGFTFAIVHASAILFFYGLGLLANVNPYANPLIFGLLAFIVYIPLYLTSTDMAEQKLGYRKWKAIHMLVYLAFILTVLHYSLINPAALMATPGYVLMAITIIVFGSELTAFARHTKTRNGIAFASLMIALAAALFYLSNSQIIMYIVIGSLIAAAILFVSGKK